MIQASSNPAVFVPELRKKVQGRLITSADADYDSVRRVFYGSFDRRPAVIVQPRDANDIAQVVALARDTGVELAIRSGGHSVAGHSTTEGGILLDLSSMKRLEIDPESRTAWADGGLTAGEYTAAAGQYNLVTGFGDTSSVGIGGLTVGGGVGYLVRKYGLTIDNLLAAEIVTADGRIRQIDASTEPDLFWAIRGGGGNFGVVSRFQFRLYPLDAIVGGMLIYEATPEIISAVMGLADAAPDELTIIANIMVAPPMPFLPEAYTGKMIMMAQMVYAGDTNTGEQVIAPFRALQPVVDLVNPMPYPEIYQLNQVEEGMVVHEVARSFFLDQIDRSVAEHIVDHLRASTALFAVTQLRVLGGALARVPVDATAFTHRDRRFMVATGAVYDKIEETPLHEAWVSRYAAALDDGRKDVYVNFLGHDGAARQAYAEATYKRLAAIKARYDPTNVFRLNHNIAPASA